LLLKKDGDRATWEYPFAVVGINTSFMLIQMLDLYSECDKKKITFSNHFSTDCFRRKASVSFRHEFCQVIR
ncbi:hypothetical protein RYX36_034626, partial [Vicia faba]